MDDSCTCVLTEWELTLASNLCVAEHGESYVLVVVGSLWVVEYSSNLLVVLTTEHEVHVVECLCGKKLESLW